MVWKIIKYKYSVGFMFGVLLAILHLCLVILAYIVYINSKSSTSALVFVWFFTLDAPVHMLPSSAFQLFGTPTPLILYGVIGSVMWFLIPWMIDKGIKALFPKINKLIRAITIIVLIPLILFGFSRLCRINIKRQIQARRPDELKKVLNQASSDFLTENIVYKDDRLASIISVDIKDILGSSDNEIIIAMNDTIVVLDEKYNEISCLPLNGLRFTSIEPVYLNEKNFYGFLGYRYGKGIWLLDSLGKEQWSYQQTNDIGLHPDGASFGDIDGDRNPEYAVYYRYKEGIHLLDSDGRVQWKHPIYALGHLEVADLNGDGNAEIIYTNSNNANGKTTFKILDAVGTISGKMDIATTSYEFEMINWPSEASSPNILLTEENTIRIINMNCQTVLSLDAPGCRTFGDVQAVGVQFENNAPNYLVVKKNLHPDLMTLYVFSRDGTLVYQKTEVLERCRIRDFAVVPFQMIGGEGILLGSIYNDQPLLIEYFLSR